MRYDQKQRKCKREKKLGKKIGIFKNKAVRGVIFGIPFTSQFGGLNLSGITKGFQLGHVKGEPK